MSRLWRVLIVLVSAMALPAYVASYCPSRCCGPGSSTSPLLASGFMATQAVESNCAFCSASGTISAFIPNDLQVSDSGLHGAPARPAPSLFSPQAARAAARVPVEAHSSSRFLALHCTFLI